MHTDIAARLAEHFPIGAPPVSLEIVPGATGEWIQSDSPRAIATIRLIVWDIGDDGSQAIRDIKEQEIDMGLLAFYDDPERVAGFFAALGVMLAEICADGTDVIDRLMPHDLLCTGVLKLKRARSREDFEAALRAKSRLGQYLGQNTAP